MKLIAPIEKDEDIVNKQYVDNKISTKVEDTETGISTALDKISNNTTNAVDTDIYITKVNNKYYKRPLNYLWNWIKTKVETLGYTKNTGTLTGIKMNGVSKGTSGVIDLGTVLTSGSQTTTSTEDGGSNVYTFSDNSTITVRNGTKGSTGTAAGFGTPTATIDANTGIPSVTITASGPATAKVFSFDFKNLKGEKGDIGEIDVVSSSMNGLAPKITDTNAFLKGDGTWSIPEDSKIKISSLNPAAAIWCYPIWSASTSGTTTGNINDGLMYNTSQGTAEKLGHSYLKLGNATASGTTGNKRGHLRIYGEDVGYSELVSAATANRLITFPDVSGTVSLDGHTHNNYLPLTGGTISGNVTFNNGANTIILGQHNATDAGEKSFGYINLYNGGSIAGNIFTNQDGGLIVRSMTNNTGSIGDPSHYFNSAYINNFDKVVMVKSSGDTYHRAERTDLTFTDSNGNEQHEDIRFGISNAGNRGIWDRRSSSWLTYFVTGSNTPITQGAFATQEGKITGVNGEVTKKVPFTTGRNYMYVYTSRNSQLFNKVKLVNNTSGNLISLDKFIFGYEIVNTSTEKYVNLKLKYTGTGTPTSPFWEYIIFFCTL